MNVDLQLLRGFLFMILFQGCIGYDERDGSLELLKVYGGRIYARNPVHQKRAKPLQTVGFWLIHILLACSICAYPLIRCFWGPCSTILVNYIVSMSVFVTVAYVVTIVLRFKLDFPVY